MLAAFTLPTIAVIVVTPPPRWAYVILSLFVASTGLLLAGFQLSVGRLFRDATPWNEIRAVLTFSGLIALAAGLALLAASTRPAGSGVFSAALVILAAGVLIPIGMNLGLWMAGRDDILPAKLGKLHQHLLRPLGVTTAPGTIAQAICGSGRSGRWPRS